jgi:hypothetical protein
VREDKSMLPLAISCDAMLTDSALSRMVPIVAANRRRMWAIALRMLRSGT